MRHKSNAQSLVEMAMVLPFLLFLCFAIIDMGWYLYGYASVYNAARRGAEVAASLPPWPRSIQASTEAQNYAVDQSDNCLGAIYKAIDQEAVMFPDILTQPKSRSEDAFTIQYVDSNNQPVNNSQANANSFRKVGGAVQVKITYYLRPLTPLLTLGRTFGFGGVDGNGNAVMRIASTSRRSIDSFGANPTHNNGMACQEYP